MKCIVILGGYGNFGKKIASQLLELPIEIIIAGRCLDKATALLNEFATEKHQAKLTAAKLDVNAADFADELQKLMPFLTIHTCGPYQQNNQNSVATTCINIGSHYIDLADARDFVSQISEFDSKAKSKNCVVISGASTVPAISSVVIDHFAQQFSQLNEIDFAIVPGNQAERGFATISGVLSYLGKPFQRWQNGQWQTVYGWMDSRVMDFGAQLGKRHLANIDIPDLALFPNRYKGVKTVKFQAGLELGWLHQSMVLMAELSKRGLVNNWQRFDKLIYNTSDKLRRFGSGDGGMQIDLSGLNHDGKAQTIRWRAVALDGVGPFIPSFPAVILTHKLLETNNGLTVGVYPALGLFGLDDVEACFAKFNISSEVIEK